MRLITALHFKIDSLQVLYKFVQLTISTMKSFLLFSFVFTLLLTNNKSIAQNKDSNSAKDFKPSVDFGFYYPTFQYGFQAKRLNINYVPGIYSQYNFARRLSVSVALLPYTRYQIPDEVGTLYLKLANDSIYQTEDRIFSVITAYHANIGVNYNIAGRWIIEGAAGYLHAYGGKGKIVTGIENPGSVLTVSEEKSHYKLSDPAFARVKKSMAYYQLHLWYSFKRKSNLYSDIFQLGLAWQHNGSGWSNYINADNYLQVNTKINLAAAFKKRQ